MQKTGEHLVVRLDQWKGEMMEWWSEGQMVEKRAELKGVWLDVE